MRNLFWRTIAPAVVFSGMLMGSCNQSEKTHQCLCSEIGIDSVWADSSNVACYKIPVSQAHDSDRGAKIHIAAIRATKTGESDAEPLLYLHGGPGIATLDNAQKYLKSAHWSSLRQNHDIIMLDYRGTGFSGPALCNDLLDSLDNFRKTSPSPEAYKKKEIELYELSSIYLKVRSY